MGIYQVSRRNPIQFLLRGVAGVFPALTELIFVYLPLVVLALVHVIRSSDFRHATDESLTIQIFSLPEVSFAAAVLFGLSIIKCTEHAVDRVKDSQKTFLVALLLVFGLVPSLTILVLVLLAKEDGNMTVLLRSLQIGNIMIASACFICCGMLSNTQLIAERQDAMVKQ